MQIIIKWIWLIYYKIVTCNVKYLVQVKKTVGCEQLHAVREITKLQKLLHFLFTGGSFTCTEQCCNLELHNCS